MCVNVTLRDHFLLHAWAQSETRGGDEFVIGLVWACDESAAYTAGCFKVLQVCLEMLDSKYDTSFDTYNKCCFYAITALKRMAIVFFLPFFFTLFTLKLTMTAKVIK